MRWICVIASLFGLALLAPAGALADGGPVPPVQGWDGIAVPGSPYQYVALAGGHRTTLIRRLDARRGATGSAIRVRGRYGIPGVGYDGTTTGLSADGHTLVLAELPGNGVPRTTRLLVADTPRLALRARIDLPGYSVVDAVSPNGRWLYLIHYAASNLGEYEVLAYDLVARHLLPNPIVDPHDRDEAMTGFPVTRVMSAGNRWAYTLYTRPSGNAFIHALDTAGRRAVCVDLPASANAAIGNATLELGPGGLTIRVDADGSTAAVVNTRTFAVTTGTAVSLDPGRVASSSASIRPAPHREDTGGAGNVPWELLAAAAALAVLGGAFRLRARHRTS